MSVSVPSGVVVPILKSKYHGLKRIKTRYSNRKWNCGYWWICFVSVRGWTCFYYDFDFTFDCLGALCNFDDFRSSWIPRPLPLTEISKSMCDTAKACRMKIA